MASEDRKIVLEDGRSVALRRSARARRLTLRVPRDGSGPVLTMPPHVPLAEGRAFVESRADWLAGASARVPQALRVRAGEILPVAGRVLELTPAATRAARIEGEHLLIPRDRDAGPSVAALLRRMAMVQLRAASDRHAAAIGRGYSSIVLRDTKSRWGSCSHEGRLMYSWRLIMAPPEILDYVAAHEVAHLRHMDHSPRFWALVAELMPGYAARRAWLRQHGGDLMLWRFTD
ncbi:SprT family zinc-dependent metalloprotease [Paracoccus sp. 1_MG-2023]|uniref:M48 family metallopeptidase n=1 Tax=unclassified Paracoccus (in: a-proteobacteria) TaxID=2688777 RepID=UPI001C09C834|nr:MULTISPECIES: SprT family zinc-dependent metalloprotease [unclassified Paracoccus (in: a-proteobacteria)]MBU2958368.1 M48 family metallopeptidase [Paracoccus sp. C2R09]MDO6670287.1 SprT family zinc-dependent metalloprotease [Paracoccus sp. 1_MG-2023]